LYAIHAYIVGSYACSVKQFMYAGSNPAR